MPVHTCVTSVPEIEVYISRCGQGSRRDQEEGGGAGPSS